MVDGDDYQLGPGTSCNSNSSCFWLLCLNCSWLPTLRDSDWTPYLPTGEGVGASCTHKKRSPYNVVWESTMETSESEWCEEWVIFNSNLCSSSDSPGTDSLLASTDITRGWPQLSPETVSPSPWLPPGSQAEHPRTQSFWLLPPHPDLDEMSHWFLLPKGPPDNT